MSEDTTKKEDSVAEGTPELRQVLDKLSFNALKEKLKNEYGQISVPFAKKPSNPSKEDMVSFIIALESLDENRTKNSIDVITVPKLDDVIKPVPAAKYNRLTVTQKRDLKDKLIRVIIRKNPLIQSLQTEHGWVEFLPWTDSRGQRRIASVAYNTPWHVPRQVLMSLNQVRSSSFVQKGNSVEEKANVHKLYDIEILPPLDIAQMKELEKTQRARKAQ